MLTESEQGESSAPTPIPNTPEVCRAVYDEPIAFGTDWTQFRSIIYSATIFHWLLPGIASLSQTVAVYPDATAARDAFDRIVAAAPACSVARTESEYYQREIRRPDPNTLVLNGGMVTDGYRVVDATLFGVSTLVPHELTPINAETVLDRLQDAQR